MQEFTAGVMLDVADAKIWGYASAVYLHMMKNLVAFELAKEPKLEGKEIIHFETKRSYIEGYTGLNIETQDDIEKLFTSFKVLLFNEINEDDLVVSFNRKNHHALYMNAEAVSQIVANGGKHGE